MRHLFKKHAFSAMLILVAILSVDGVYAVQPITEIVLPGKGIFPESITSTSDGTLIIGSLGHGNVLRIAPGKTTAEEWIKPGTGGLNGVLGVAGALAVIPLAIHFSHRMDVVGYRVGVDDLEYLSRLNTEHSRTKPAATLVDRDRVRGSCKRFSF